MSPSERDKYRKAALPYLSKGVPVAFAATKYGPLRNFEGTEFRGKVGEVVGFSGLAKNQIFKSYLDKIYPLKQFFSFPDHYDYSLGRIADILKAGTIKTTFICSEKDWVKVRDLVKEQVREGFTFLYQPIDLAFLEGEEQFLDLFRLRMEEDQE
jgi:tetraacyldisaccharide-1-P 4'-kinase